LIPRARLSPMGTHFTHGTAIDSAAISFSALNFTVSVYYERTQLGSIVAH
jgi:hypothetical protein